MENNKVILSFLLRKRILFNNHFTFWKNTTKMSSVGNVIFQK